MSNECDESGEAIDGPFVRTNKTAFDFIKNRVAQSDYFRSVCAVDLSNTSVSDNDIQRLQKFRELRYVSLNDTEVSDAAIPHLLLIGTLRKIELNSTNVTEDGFKHLVARMPAVEVDWKPKKGVIDDILDVVGDKFGGRQTVIPNNLIIDP